MTNNQEPNFFGVWIEVDSKREVEWKFARDDVYSVRQLLDDWAMLTDLTTCRVTNFRR